MYHSHFGLAQAPFKITPNTEFFFGGGNRGPILEAMIYAISNGEGIVKVTGEVGSGKTMLCNMLQMRLPAHIETVYLAHPSVSPDEILHAIAFELQLKLDRDATRLEVMQALHEYLLRRHADGRRVVVFVEESQSMPLATLEEIRLLSNLETRNDKLLQIVLFGQPELDDNLGQSSIRQLRERITHSFRLEPLGIGEIREYLMFRMRAAGYRGPDLFSSTVVRRMAHASGGLTRRINLIADKALLAAFSENTHTIRPKHVDAAVRDSEFSQRRGLLHLRYGRTAALLLAGAVLGATGYALVQYGSKVPARASAIAPATAERSASPAAVPTVPPPSRAAPPAMIKEAQKADSQKTAPSPPHSRPAAGTGAVAPGSSLMDSPPAASVKAAPPAAGGADLVEQRLAATREWLTRQLPSTVSIQLMGTHSEEQLRNHLKVLSKFIEINDVFVYRTMAKQKPSVTVLYGSFKDLRAAQEALEKLPPFLKENRPLLRTIQGIRTEIRQRQQG
ncbi:MAG TPA: AAA family ATPase [Burkholderiales bacterium]|nr:AAA family ATPase [Burkholderiales bacterium]